MREKGEKRKKDDIIHIVDLYIAFVIITSLIISAHSVYNCTIRDQIFN